MLERFDRSDVRFLLICALILAAGLTIGLRWFGDAFPEASIEFDVDRSGSGQVAKAFLKSQGIDPKGWMHSATFTWDDSPKIFLERTIGLRRANALMRNRVKVWTWENRWFRPLHVEEISVDVSPTGRIVGFHHRVAEDAPAGKIDRTQQTKLATHFLRSLRIPVNDLTLVSRSEIQRAKRTDTILTWESKSLHPGHAPYRYSITFQGDQIGNYREWLEVPESWKRDYAELRSRNSTTGMVDTVFLLATILLATGLFVARIRRGDIHLRWAIGAAITGAILVTLVQLNQFPTDLANYNTDTSFLAFVALRISAALVDGLGTGLFLLVVVGAGDVMIRERMPRSLAIPRLFSFQALRSKRVFKGFVLGYTLFAAFLAYQVVFYLTASHFGAWSPQDIPYDDILNTAFPWLSVLFIGFFPAMSEEYLCRAFSIPFFEKLMRSPVAAVIVAGFIWGFGHAAYPNQPFYIRGVEVGIAGIVIGTLLLRFGLLPLLVWHYTVDALYTSLILFRSGNLYYVLTGGAATFVFLVPAIVSLALYWKHGGFIGDSSLENSTLPVKPPEPPAERPRVVEPLPPPVRQGGRLVVATIVSLAILALVAIRGGPTPGDIVDYRMSAQTATEIARQEIQRRGLHVPERSIVIPAEGFRSWNAKSSREDGGSPGGYASAAARYIARESTTPIKTILAAQRDKVQAATWVVRFFTPRVKEEIFVEIDPRVLPSPKAVVGFHRYLEETEPGATLDRAAAEKIAFAELEHDGLRPADFEVKEALSYKKPKRLDWLFHLAEKTPIAGEARRRVTIRVTGDRVSQFAKTVHIPEEIARKANKQTAGDVALFLLKIAGIVATFAFVVSGIAVYVRKSSFEWKRALRITAWLSPIPCLVAALQIDSILVQYDTSVKWATFVVFAGVSLFVIAAFQLLIVWLSLAVIDTMQPVARRIFSKEARGRFGRHAAIAAIATLAIAAILGRIPDLLVSLVPRYAALDDLSIPALIGTSLPAISALWSAVFRTLAGCAAAASIGYMVTSAASRTRRIQILLGFLGSLALAALDPSVPAAQTPIMLLEAILPALAVYLIARFVLGRNLLAWPTAIFCAVAVSDAFELIENHRLALEINGSIVLAVVAIILIALALSRESRDPWAIVPGEGDA